MLGNHRSLFQDVEQAWESSNEVCFHTDCSISSDVMQVFQLMLQYCHTGAVISLELELIFKYWLALFFVCFNVTLLKLPESGRNAVCLIVAFCLVIWVFSFLVKF